tara:strand:+ start:412 stop:1500 length:1089 start_codon:yes stop_codon:yes gene_type:complete
MDLNGVSNALAQSNNYISNYNDAVGNIRNINDTMQLRRQQATGQAESTTDMDAIKDTILTGKSIVGTGGAFKNYATFSKGRKSARVAERLGSSVESAVEQGTKDRINNMPIPGANEPSPALSGDSAQPLGHADNPRPQATAQPEEERPQQGSIRQVSNRTADDSPEPQTQQQAQQSAKEDEGDEVRGAEPVEEPKTQVGALEAGLDEAGAPKKTGGIGSKIASAMEISEETAGKLGSMAGGAAGLAGLTMGIMSDEHGGWHRMNGAERVGNVASIVGGGAETIGTALDMTGVGAVVGVPLQVIGGVADLIGGLFSGGAEIKKDEAKKEAAKAAEDKPEIQAPTVQATAQTAGVIPTIQTQSY